MSKMKHILRKLHIGGGINEHQRFGEARPTTNPSPSPSPSTPASSSSTSGSATMGRIGAVEPADDRTAVDGCVDFNLLEEEFQMQMALAISASDPDAREDPETAQINAAKRISLGCAAPVPDSQAVVKFLSLRYWSYNVVNYHEKVMDGFYDVYGITSKLDTQGKMPLLVDLQAISISDNVDYEVILVNRLADLELQKLEKRACTISMECPVSEHGPILSGLIQKIADLVVDRMGGVVRDADEMLRRWSERSYELRNSLNTIILPLGCLDIGLSRHRALLFKVLADRINLPCMLVKGSYYTGTDDGAVNFIKMDNGSEYIIDLMGAPGILIPAEVPNSQLPNFGFDMRSFVDVLGTTRDMSLAVDEGTRTLAVPPDLGRVLEFGSSKSDEASALGIQTEENQTERFEYQWDKLLPSLHKSCESSSGTHGKASSAQKKKVKDVSKYVISAAKNPEFAQKLHAVLLESGASPPPDLFSDINPHDLAQGFVLIGSGTNEPFQTDAMGVNMVTINHPQMVARPLHEEQFHESFLDTAADSYQRQRNIASVSDDKECFQDNIGRVFSDLEYGKESSVKLLEATNNGLGVVSDANSEGSNPVPREVAEWEIRWEDLQIGERIGIGSYGEVYRADWNGTEVAVKKFLDQDLSGDALAQVKCEVEIMLRLRHPNVVLFMGAVTRPPNFSILTEFLPRGSLYRILHRPNPPIDEKRRMRMALDVAKGMNYLHTSHPTIVHRDLKSPNLLVDKNWVVKVCDFGLSRMKHHTFLSSKSTAGTPEWMAPEVLRNERANEKCDVYSFGVILWEITTLGIPWKGLNPMQVVGAVGFQNKRLEIPDEVDPAVAQIIQDCWQTDPQLRPSFSQLMSRLRHLQRLVVSTN
ncbi:probable serine/threonine-protein kinase SIS8 isoform X2 [Corylus avellana]|uniref:probable serine/threonine-protein kinase SIS8 isoform X2 n=1 Tax=Corylus avellana TaxID=13451 RepID=UPI00286A527B|nr:probable serine/threonine-protein kinase SIS8 isoform X2 [Corylus avellana]